MRWLPKAIPVLIAIIALDFALVFGFEAWRILNSPIAGLEQMAFANIVYGLGKIFGLKTTQHVQLAAFMGFVNLSIAVMFTLHLASRIGALRGGRVSHELLDAALILVVVSTILAATPAVLQGATEVLIQQRLPLWLVGLAATLSMIECLPEADEGRRRGLFERFVERLLTWLSARRRADDHPVVAPVVRNDTPSARWNDLRAEAGMTTQPKAMRTEGPWFALHGR